MNYNQKRKVQCDSFQKSEGKDGRERALYVRLYWGGHISSHSLRFLPSWVNGTFKVLLSTLGICLEQIYIFPFSTPILGPTLDRMITFGNFLSVYFNFSRNWGPRFIWRVILYWPLAIIPSRGKYSWYSQVYEDKHSDFQAHSSQY